MEQKNVLEDENIGIKQAFLSSAIADISSYIHLTDTKVSIMLAAVIAVIAAIISCLDSVVKAVENIQLCNCSIMFCLVLVISLILFFTSCILTIQSHSSDINYESKWFIRKSIGKYSFEEYKKDIQLMTSEDIIENMAAELYKLNDINRQKAKTYKWAVWSFSTLLITVFFMFLLIVVPC